MKKIRILQLPIANRKGGITEYIRTNQKFIDHSKFTFDFISFSPELDFEAELLADGCRIFKLPPNSHNRIAAFKNELNNILSDNKYDVFHIHNSFYRGIKIENIAKFHNIPIIILHAHSCEIDAIDKRLNDKLLITHNKQLRELNEDSATYFCTCSDKAAEFQFADKIPPEKIIFLKNAINTIRFKFCTETRQRIRARLCIRKDDFLFGHVGRFCYQKNHEFLITAFAKAAKLNPNIKLVLVGGGELFGNVNAQIDSLFIRDKVLCIGTTDDVNLIYSAMDAFLLPSRFEGLSLVLVEAQTNGLRCLASNNNTSQSHVGGDLEFLPPDTDIWTQKMLQLTKSSPEDRTQMCDRVAANGFDIKTQIKIIEDLYCGKL